MSRKRVIFLLTNGRRTEVVLSGAEATRMLAALKNGKTVEIAHGNTGDLTLVRQSEIWSQRVVDA